MSKADLDAARACIGRTSTHVYEVCEKDIRRYAQAVGFGREAEDEPPLNAVPTPPLFFHALAFDDVDPTLLPADGRPVELDLPLPVDRVVGGSSEAQLHAQIRAGDLITVAKTIADVYEKHGRSGRLIFVVLDTTFTNQNSQVVARERATFIHR